MLPKVLLKQFTPLKDYLIFSTYYDCGLTNWTDFQIYILSILYYIILRSGASFPCKWLCSISYLIFHYPWLILAQKMTSCTPDYQKSSSISPCHFPLSGMFYSFSLPSHCLHILPSFSSSPPQTPAWVTADLRTPGRACLAPCTAWPLRAGTGWAGRPSSGKGESEVPAGWTGWRTETVGCCCCRRECAVLHCHGYWRETRN